MKSTSKMIIDIDRWNECRKFTAEAEQTLLDAVSETINEIYADHSDAMMAFHGQLEDDAHHTDSTSVARLVHQGPMRSTCHIGVDRLIDSDVEITSEWYGSKSRHLIPVQAIVDDPEERLRQFIGICKAELAQAQSDRDTDGI